MILKKVMNKSHGKIYKELGKYFAILSKWGLHATFELSPLDFITKKSVKLNPLIFTAINVAPSLPNSKLSHCSIDTNTFHECGLYFSSIDAICFLTDPFAVKLELSQMVHFCAFCFSCTYALWAFNFLSTAKLLLHMVHL